MAGVVADNLRGQQHSNDWTLFSYPLIFLGILKFSEARKWEGKNLLSLIPLLTFGLATVFFGIALVLDWFGTVIVVENFLSLPTTDNDPAFLLYSFTHQLALRFFIPNLVLHFATVGLISRWALKHEVISRWFHVLGIVIGVVAVIGYPFGVYGYLWENFTISGILSALAMVWFISLGVFVFRYKTSI